MPAICLSIIIPVYNAEAFLKRCLDSILSQNIDNIEIICINDGSTDNSREVLDQYQVAYGPVITVINQPNKGVSAARNAGIDKAAGQYIMFVDADDYLLPNTLKTGLSEVQEFDSDLTIFSTQHSTRNGKLHTNVTAKKQYNSPLACFKVLLDLDDLTFGSLWSKVYKKEIIKQHNLKLDPQLRLHEDACFNYCYLKKCTCVQTLPLVLYCYDISFSNTTCKFYGDVFFSCEKIYLDAIRDVCNFYAKQYCSENFTTILLERKLQVFSYNIVFQIYNLFRSRENKKYYHLTRLSQFANEQFPNWSYNLESGIPKIVGILSRHHLFILYLFLSLVFFVERNKKQKKIKKNYFL